MHRLRIAVIGHVEHVTLGAIDGTLRTGDVLHLKGARVLPGGGGGIAFAQLCRSDAEIHFFTAIGEDDAGRVLRSRLEACREGVHVHAALRTTAHPRVVVVVDTDGHRTIVVPEPPLQPKATDPLPWSILANCDAVYFTGADVESLRLARSARKLVATARRAPVLRAAAVAPDVVIGSVADPRENAPLEAYAPPPVALVLTDGPRDVRIERSSGRTLVAAPTPPARIIGDYGAGDSFAAALTYHLAAGATLEEACRLAGPHGAAVLAGMDPLETQIPLKEP